MRFWRKRELEEAKEAFEQSKRDRPIVERYVQSLFARQEVNNFAPMIEEAFKSRGHK